MKRLVQTITCLCILLYACKEELPDRLYITDDQQQISTYLENRADMTIFTELLNQSGYYHLLNSYGRYTVFAPTDQAWNRYLSSLGKNDISSLSEAERAELFDFHVLKTGVDLKAQRTGLLSSIDTTMSGITHFVDLTGGFSNIVMNKTSLVQEIANLPNGFVYTMSEVFAPRPYNVFDYLKKNGYSIFAQAVETVGMTDTLRSRQLYYPNSIYTYHPRWTIFAESDDVFRKAGISNLEQLKDAVWSRQQNDDPDPDAALREFVRYHILFLWNWSNVRSTQKLTSSLYQQENLRTYAHNKSRVLNIAASDPAKPEPIINGSVKLNLKKSDVSFHNGVLHDLTEVMFINKEPQLCRYVYECEEVYSREVISILYSPNSMTVDFRVIPYDVDWEKKRGDFLSLSNGSFSSSFYDVLGYGYAAYVTPTERGFWIDFYLRNVPAGKYDVYLNYRRIKATCSEKVNVYFRKFGEDYDFSTQKLNSATLNFSDESRSVKGIDVAIPEYNQNLFIGRICKKNGGIEEALDSGDYVMRFVHGDMKVAYYDNIILIPVE